MSARAVVAERIASAFLSGEWRRSGLVLRASAAFNGREDGVRELARQVLERWPRPPRGGVEALSHFIAHSHVFNDVWVRGKLPRHVAANTRVSAAQSALPELRTVGDLATWLGVTADELRWFSDTSGLERTRRRESARNYVHQWVPRGEKLPRLLEAPKARLKSLQRKVLHELLEKLPVHDAAHGFVSGRSAVTHARLHVGKRVVVRFDLRHFFTSIDTARALGVLRLLGYSQEVRAALLGLCTTRTPNQVLQRAPVPDLAEGDELNDRFVMLRRLEHWHFPQGAPTSPAWANLCSWWLDVRLSAYAKKFGLTYSRYADDLVFSGDQLTSIERLRDVVDGVVRDEGFLINRAKTKVMHAHERQFVTGVVVNERPNVTRVEFDQLKALLHRCEMKGALSQSKGPVSEFRAELEGKVAWVSQLNPTRGTKLRSQLARIDWTDA